MSSLWLAGERQAWTTATNFHSCWWKISRRHEQDRLARLLRAGGRAAVRGEGGGMLLSRGFCIQAYEAIFFPDLLS